MSPRHSSQPGEVIEDDAGDLIILVDSIAVRRRRRRRRRGGQKRQSAVPLGNLYF